MAQQLKDAGDWLERLDSEKFIDPRAITVRQCRSVERIIASSPKSKKDLQLQSTSLCDDGGLSSQVYRKVCAANSLILLEKFFWWQLSDFFLDKKLF